MFAPFGHRPDPALICAHRGDNSVAPENTRAAFIAAAERGAHLCEIDVRLTADGVPIVFHDADLVRIAGRADVVHRGMWEDLRDTDIGSHFADRFSGERILTLPEALALFRDLRLGAMIEIKDLYSQPGPLESAITEAVLATDMLDNVLISSFDHVRLRTLRAHLSDLATIGIVHSRHGDVVSMAQAAQLSHVSIEFKTFDPQDAARLRAANIGVACAILSYDRDFGEIASARLVSLREAIAAGNVQILTVDDVAWGRALLRQQGNA